VKRVIQGTTYDTDTAQEVTGGESPHSMGWWGLYRTQSGAFFKVVVDHDGSTVNEFRPLTDADAQAVLERHANHLVEQYFGSMPEASPMRFSRRTVIAAIEILEREFRTHSSLTRCLLKWSSLLKDMCEGSSLEDRFNQLISFYDGQPGYRVEDGNLLGEEIVEKAVTLLPPAEPQAPWSAPEDPSPRVAAFLRALDLDGFTVAEGALRRALPEVVDLPQAEDQIRRLLGAHNFSLARGHLDQAFAAHTDGLWAAANSQIRSFFDALLDEITERLDPAAAALPTGQPRRAKLAALGFLSRDLNEWDDKGLGFVNGLVKRLHPHGSHPGLSDQDDSTFRLHTVLIAARLFLARFDSWR
jgi:hypothetical protein